MAKTNKKLRLYTPQKTAYLASRLVRRLVGALIAILVLLGLALFYESSTGLLAVPLLAVTAVIYIIANSIVSYRKQSYKWGFKDVLFKSGTLTSDFETELKYTNITHVRLIKPFLEYKIFGTGNILIEAAGSASTEILMRSVENPEDAYVEIQEILSESTFDLSYDKLLLKERPAPLAVGLEVAGSLSGAIVATVFALNTLGGGAILAAAVDFLPLLGLILIGGVLGSFLAIGVTIYFYALYQDLIRRTYFIYGDVLCYKRGFLTKQEAFIPIENLADSELTQSLLDKLLNLYDVVVSCQGSGSEIEFRNLVRGREIERTIDSLISTRAQNISEKAADTAPLEDKEFEQDSTVYDTDGQTSYYMQPKRALLWYVWLFPFFLAFPPLLLMPVYTYFVTKNTQYRPTSSGVASHFSLFSTQNVEFSRDKITAVVINRNIIDRWMGTVTVNFWSVGSTKSVKFRHIKDYPDLDEDMLMFGGITSSPELEQLRPQFNLDNMIRGNLYSAVGLAAVAIASLVAGFWLSLAWLILPTLLVASLALWFVFKRRYSRAKLTYYKSSVWFRIGWLRQVDYYANYQDVKDITIEAYPGGRVGSIHFNIAGEQFVGDRYGSSYRPNGFSVHYMVEPSGRDHIHEHIFDQILLKHPGPEQYEALKSENRPATIKRASRPSLKNSFAQLSLLHLILLPLLPLLPLTLLATRLWLRRTSYILEDERLIKRWGIIYRKQKSIIHSKLDYIQYSQTFTEKIFKNGTISMYTTGSRQVELQFKEMSDYRDFYSDIKNIYEV